MTWRPIETAPYQQVIEVRNSVMKNRGDSVLATRGYAADSGVCAEPGYCTSIYTPDEFGGFPGGRLVCAEEWRDPPSAEDKAC